MVKDGSRWSAIDVHGVGVRCLGRAWDMPRMEGAMPGAIPVGRGEGLRYVCWMLHVQVERP